jgi:hypothetical protein
MQFSCDRTGFPLVAVPALALEVQVLPVTKVQFERFIAEPNAFGDVWYEEVLALNPRVSSRRFTVESRERLFLTGILPEEALAFAKWMGEGFDLPTVAEWRAIYAALAAEAAPLRHLIGLLSERGTILACDLLSRVGTAHPPSLLDLSFMQGGVVEWVRQGNTWTGLGAPRPEFHPNLWNPQIDEVRPLRAGARVPFFWFSVGAEVPSMIRALRFRWWVRRSENTGGVTREKVLKGPARLDEARAVEPLIQQLKNPDFLVRLAACGALGELGEGRLAGAVLGALKGKEAAYKELAKLGAEGDVRAVEPLIVQLGGSNDGRRAAYQALVLISKQTNPQKFLCRSCLCRFERKIRKVTENSSVNFVACRYCGRTATAVRDVGEVIAVLDAESSQELKYINGRARVNWLKRQALFDFDTVEVIGISEYEVERFCVQVGNDTDSFRRPRYRKMSCTVDPQSDLSPSALNMLKSTFGEVKVKTIRDQ